MLMADNVQAFEVEAPDPLAYASVKRGEKQDGQYIVAWYTFIN